MQVYFTTTIQQNQLLKLKKRNEKNRKVLDKMHKTVKCQRNMSRAMLLQLISVLTKSFWLDNQKNRLRIQSKINDVKIHRQSLKASIKPQNDNKSCQNREKSHKYRLKALFAKSKKRTKNQKEYKSIWLELTNFPSYFC